MQSSCNRPMRCACDPQKRPVYMYKRGPFTCTQKNYISVLKRPKETSMLMRCAPDVKSKNKTHAQETYKQILKDTLRIKSTYW